MFSRVPYIVSGALFIEGTRDTYERNNIDNFFLAYAIDKMWNSNFSCHPFWELGQPTPGTRRPTVPLARKATSNAGPKN